MEADPKSFNRPAGNLSSQRMVAFCHKNWPEPSEFSLLQEVLEPSYFHQSLIFRAQSGGQFPDKPGGKACAPPGWGSSGSGAQFPPGLVMMLTLWMMLMSMLMRISEAAVDDEDGDDDEEQARQGGLLSRFCCSIDDEDLLLMMMMMMVMMMMMMMMNL